MTDNEIIDIVLRELHKNASKPYQYLKSTIFKLHNINIDKDRIARLIIILTSKNLVTDVSERSNIVGEICLRIAPKGIYIIDEFGSFSDFFESENRAQKTTSREKAITRILAFVSAGGVIWAAIFAYLNYDKVQLMKDKDKEIRQYQYQFQKQNKMIDSLTVIIRNSNGRY
jgi:hypothetical protein